MIQETDGSSLSNKLSWKTFSGNRQNLGNKFIERMERNIA